MAEKNRLLKYIFIFAGGLIILCGACVVGSLGMDALGLLQTDTPSLHPTQISRVEASLAPNPTSEPTFTLVPTNALPPTSIPTAAEVSQETAFPDCVPENTKQELGVVVGVVDGDTIDVLLEDGQTYRVRYIGMDTPENGDPYFEEATNQNRELVEGKAITLVKDVSETDRYDRLLRYVFVESTFVNLELVKQGYAKSATYPPDVACADTFVEAQREANDAGLGLWGLVALAQPTAAPTQPPAPTDEPTSPPSQGQGGQVVIRSIYFDGAVPRVESDEYAEIANVGSDPVDLKGWVLNAGDPGQNFNFPSYVLNPGQFCRVYTNENHPDTCGFSFGSGQAIWNNKGDCGYLYNSKKEVVSEYCY
jgi:micrococcal nuclease